MTSVHSFLAPEAPERRSPSFAVPGTRGADGDKFFRILLWASGGLVFGLLGLIIALLFIGGWPALATFGPGFYISPAWNPVTEQFGALTMVYGTLVTSLIAILVAVPMSFGVAFFLTEIAPPALRRPIGIGVQLLAAIPSIIYGMWGLFIVVPLMKAYVEPALITTFQHVPGLSVLFKGPAPGVGLFTAGLILALMIIPFITAIFVEVIEAVPPMLKESAYGVGATTYEVFRRVSVPYGGTALVGAVMLGLGRALGETMAVAFVVGNATRISASLLAPGATIASTIANEFPEASAGSLKFHALLQLGFLLFAMSFLVLAVSRALLRRKKARAR